jgi:glutaredoxin
MKVLVPAVLALMFAAQAQGGQLYRWVDAEGKVHYTDKQPPLDARDIEKKQVETRVDASPLPYTLQQASKAFPVTVYNADCGDPCDQARALLDRRGIPYTARNAREPEVQVELKKLTGGTVDVPVIQVGRIVVKGWESNQWNTALDSGGYPQVAVWKRPPTAAPEKKKATKEEAKAANGETVVREEARAK